MAAKTWDRDFRFDAIQASIRKLNGVHRDDPFAFPGSFCVPMNKKPVVGWTPGRVALIVLVLGLALLVGGIVLGTKVRDRVPDRHHPFLLTLATCCSMAGFAMFFVPAKCDRYILSWLIGSRGHELKERSPTAETMTAELGNGSSKVKLSIDGDDHVLIVFDEANRRLMMEGIGARYQIRAADVEKLSPFEQLNYVGVRITYRIDSETSLRVGIARVSMLLEIVRQVPILFFLRRFIPNKLLQNAARTLGTTGEA